MKVCEFDKAIIFPHAQSLKFHCLESATNCPDVYLVHFITALPDELKCAELILLSAFCIVNTSADGHFGTCIISLRLSNKKYLYSRI